MFQFPTCEPQQWGFGDFETTQNDPSHKSDHAQAERNHPLKQ